MTAPMIPSTGNPDLDREVDLLFAATSGPAHVRDTLRRQVSHRLHGKPPAWERPARSKP